jgi:phage-related protein
MPDTFPSIRHSYAVPSNVQAQILQNKFGDGYSERAAQGLNNESQVWQLSWNNRPISDIDTIEAFIKAAGGYQSFYWTPPRGSAPLLFFCQKWSRTYSGPKSDDFSATFEQVFDIV